MVSASRLRDRQAEAAELTGPSHGQAAREHDIAIEDVMFNVKTRDGGTMQIIDGVSLRVNPGEFVAIVGPSGCGKSTLLNFIAGLLQPTSGAIRRRQATAGEESLGYIFQSDALLPWRTVEDNVALGLELRGVRQAERRRRANEMLQKLGLDQFARHLPSELSGGMRQRVSLARTWVMNPAILLLDEPFGALDAQTRLIVQDMFCEYWERERKTVLMVTHDIDEAIQLADRVIVLSMRPAHIIAEHVIPFDRPRRRDALRADPRYNGLWEEIWAQLRSDAARALEEV